MNEIKYGFSRRIQLKNYIPSAHGFESAEFVVQGAETKKEAEKETMDWFKDYVDRNNKKAGDKEKPKVKDKIGKKNDLADFEKGLDKDIKEAGIIPNGKVEVKQEGSFMVRV